MPRQICQSCRTCLGRRPLLQPVQALEAHQHADCCTLAPPMCVHAHKQALDCTMSPSYPPTYLHASCPRCVRACACVRAGVSKVVVRDFEVASELLGRAVSARAVDPASGAYAAGGHSDIVFVLRVTAVHPATGTRLSGCLNLVDLADK